MLSALARGFRRWRARGPLTVCGRDGFTLVEIMMVLVILSIGVLPLAIIQHRARREVTESDHYTRALTVAQSELERIKGLGFGEAAADSGVTDIVTWRATVTNVSMGMDRIELTASWQQESGVESVSISDLVSMR